MTFYAQLPASYTARRQPRAESAGNRSDLAGRPPDNAACSGVDRFGEELYELARLMRSFRVDYFELTLSTIVLFSGCFCSAYDHRQRVCGRHTSTVTRSVLYSAIGNLRLGHPPRAFRFSDRYIFHNLGTPPPHLRRAF